MSNVCKTCGSKNIYVGFDSIECLDACGKASMGVMPTLPAPPHDAHVSMYPTGSDDGGFSPYEDDGVTPYGWVIYHHDNGDC